MAMEIKIGANVTPAIDGMRQVEKQMRSTVAAGQSFGKGIDRVSQSLKNLPNNTNQATQSLMNLSRVAQDAPYGFIGIANNINPLLESFQRLKASTGTTGGALKAMGSQLMGPAGLGLAVGVVSSLLVVFGDRLFGAGKAAEKAKTATDELKSSINGVFSSAAKEAAQVGSFISILKNEAETRERKLAAIKELQKIQPEVFNGLKLEGNAVVGLDNAYKSYLDNLKNVISAKIIQVKLESKIEELLKRQGVAATAEEKALMKLPDLIDSINKKRAEKLSGADAAGLMQMITGRKEARQNEIKSLEDDIKGLFSDLQNYTKAIKVDTLGIKPTKVTIEKPTEQVFDLSKWGRLELPVGTAVLRMQKLLLDEPKQLTFAEGLQKKLTEEISKLVVAPNIGIAENKEAKEAAEKRLKQMQDTANIITNTLQPAFEAFFTTIATGGGNAFRAFAQAAKAALTQLIAKMATAAALSLVLGGMGLGEFVGAGSNKFGSIFSTLLGLGKRAGGGPVGGGGAYLVGENGPEIFQPSMSGSIIPNHQLGSSGGGGGTMRAIVRGQNILLSVARTSRSNNRLGLNGI